MKARNGWWKLAPLSARGWIHYTNDEIDCIATNADNLDLPEDAASDVAGRVLESDTWFCIADSPHASLIEDHDGSVSVNVTDRTMLAGVT